MTSSHLKEAELHLGNGEKSPTPSGNRPVDDGGLTSTAPASVIRPAAKPATTMDTHELWESFQERLAQLLCLATESDQVVVASVHRDRKIQEQARYFSHEGAAQNWADWPPLDELASAILRQPPAKDGSQPVCSEQELALASPGPLLTYWVPVERQERLVFCLFRLPGRSSFSPREATLLRHLAGLWREATSLQDTQWLVHVRLLTQIAQYGGSQRDLGAILRFALRELNRHLPGTLVSVWTLQATPTPRLQLAACGELPCFIGKGTSGAALGSSTSSWHGLAAELNLEGSPLLAVIGQQQILYLESLAEQPAAELQHWAKLGFAVCAALPLLVGRESMGVLVLLTQHPSGFTRMQIQLAHAVADLLGPLIACHQLNQRLEQMYQQLQKAQHQLSNAEKMRALGEMASGMAHDFNNALCGTLGFLELALKDPQLPPSVEELLRMARTCALDAAATVRRVQDFARWDRGLLSAELVAINDLVRQVVELTRPRWQDAAQAQSRTIEMQLDLQAQHPVMANTSELREVFTNLIFNAVDAMPQGGRITIATASDHHQVTIRISDTGVGMPPEVQQRLFEPFFTTKKERGTGLGLSVSYAIVKRHGGQITVESQPGRGTTFTIQLPVVRELAAEATANSSTSSSPVARSLRVLVVDDEPHILAFLRQCLLHLGHYPETISDAEQAVAQLHRQAYDLVITDLGMPKLSGEQLAQQVYQHNPALPVILLTGWGEQLRHGHTLPPNIRHILAKPITVEQLAQSLRQVQEQRA